MRTATAALLVVLLALMGATVVFGLTGVSGGGTLTEQWISNTERDFRVNHHPVAAAQTGDGAIVVAPINEQSTTADLSDTSCVVARLDPANGTTTWQAGLPAANCTIHSLTGPTIADLDGDGRMEVLVATGNRTLVTYDATAGTVEWRHGLSDIGYGAPAVADLLPAAGKEVVVVDIDGGVYTVHANGTTAWSRNTSASTWASPQIDDFDGDGGAEIAVTTGESTVLYEANGTRSWRTNGSGTWAGTGQADDDRAPELFVSHLEEVTAYRGTDGTTVWSRDFGSIAASRSVHDGDGDGVEEVYVGLGGGTVVALDATDGSTEWTTRFRGENRVMAPPTTGDVDGDGSAEVVAVAQSGAAYVLDPSSGERLATYEREVPVWTHPTVADVDGDGDEDVLVMYGDGRVVALSYET